MGMRGRWIGSAAVACVALAMPAIAQSARDILTQAAFEDRNRDTALSRVDRVRDIAAARPNDEDYAVLAAVALGYRAKLTGSRSEATAARKEFETVCARFPRNAEAQLGLGAWHLGVINRVGRLVGRVVGAQRGTGIAAIERSVALGGNRAMFAGFAGMMLIELDPEDARGRTLLETAVRAPAPTPLDRIVQRSAAQVAATLRQGNAKQAQELADRLLPFGWYRPK
ncbi:hypothetical protein ASG07_04900 [Sphingomonas sp. Leaf343]|nr:hypothetical protein ASG07_04900 [Sphingomonas sp. Leaf343]